MDSSQQQKQDGIMEVPVPEVHGDLLMELLDASLAAENAVHHQLGSVGDVGCWIDDCQESYDIHAHQDCEDCGLDGGGILLDFDEYHGGSRWLRSPAVPYVVFDHDDTLEWAETADDDTTAMDPFASECTGGWYMDGLVMAMEWDEEQDDGGFPFEACYGGDGDGAAEQVYASPLWE